MLGSAASIAMGLQAGLIYGMMFSSKHAKRLREAHHSAIQNEVPVSQGKLEEGLGAPDWPE